MEAGEGGFAHTAHVARHGSDEGKEEDEHVKKNGKVQVLFFARARELAGVSEVTLEIEDGWTTLHCFEAIVAKFPALKPITSCIVVALNQSYVSEPVGVKDGDELALIPPISGG